MEQMIVCGERALSNETRESDSRLSILEERKLDRNDKLAE